jgi:thiamine biosynthesis lipoprotein ApbE
MTIIANKGIDAEGLSTGLYIMGIDGIKKLNTMKEYAGIMIDDKKVYLTRNLKGKFILKDKKYIVEVIEN